MTVGSTSQRARIFIQDVTKTDGSGLPALVYNTSGLTCYYIRSDQGSMTQVTLANATVGTFTSGGFIEVDQTNAPGLYEFGIPDAAISVGIFTTFYFKGATNMAPIPLEIQLTAFDLQTANPAVTLTSSERNSVSDALLDRSAGIESGLTPRQSLKLMSAILIGLVSGFPAGPGVFTSADISSGSVVGTKNRVTATVTGNGNRSAISVDLS